MECRRSRNGQRSAGDGAAIETSDWISSVLRSLGEAWELPECPPASNPTSTPSSLRNGFFRLSRRPLMFANFTLICPA